MNLGSDSDDDIEKILDKGRVDLVYDNLDDDSSDPPSQTESCENLENIINEALDEPMDHDYVYFDLEQNEFVEDELPQELPNSMNTCEHIETVQQTTENSILIIVPPTSDKTSFKNLIENKNTSKVNNLNTASALNTSPPVTTRKITRSQKNETVVKQKNEKKNPPEKFEFNWKKDTFNFKAEIPANTKPSSNDTVKTPYEYFCLFFTENIYDLIVVNTNIYSMQEIEEERFGLGAKVVIALSKTITNPACSVVYFDNFFSSFDSIYRRESMGIFLLGTLRNNRIRDCKLEDDKSMKKRGRGSYCQHVSNELNTKLAVIKWFDNKFVILVSSFADAYPLSSVKRYYKENKKRVDVVCPQIVLEYNQHMGGVDLADMFVALYRTVLKSKRWYLGIFSQFLDICVNNSWVLYKEDFNRDPNNESKKKMPLKDFRIMISEGLLQKNRIRGRPSNLLKSTENCPIRSTTTTKSCVDMQYDCYGHFLIFSMSRGRCKLCININHS
ncbi:hypothetical protein NQ314_016630 [Rhamnusium bicolor]|uniref:PiggyBac transposable element-derived protein domain-containing protein n=1 Tax=Rhamnusium bicolor TaxID=1586634 RepID=A0AAV8WV59_9CUCU|nr:hypothetical protein NQ314_016630 [Rhamnusium bicolor]